MYNFVVVRLNVGHDETLESSMFNLNNLNEYVTEKVAQGFLLSAITSIPGGVLVTMYKAPDLVA